MNGKDVLSRYAQGGNDFRAEFRSSSWLEEIVHDQRASIVDQVAAKLDVSAWFATLNGARTRQIAQDLAFGGTTSEVAAKHGVTAGRISQLRRTLEESWQTFQREASPAIV